MTNKFRFITLLKLYSMWLFSYKEISFFIGEKRILFFSSRTCMYYTFKNYLYLKKQELIISKLGEEKLLEMTINNIYKYRI